MPSAPITVDALLAEKGESLLKDLPFEGGLKLLEQLVSSVETGNLPLDKSILAYERGASLILHLRSLLTGAEEKLRVLQKPFNPAE